MSAKRLALAVGILLLTAAALLAWAPWVSTHSAEAAAVRSFERQWREVADGCGFNCSGCGAVASRRAPFGARVTLEYACGLLPADLPEYHQRAEVFVSPFGSVHGAPRP